MTPVWTFLDAHREWEPGDVAMMEVGCHANRHVGMFMAGGGWRYGDDKWVADDPAIVTARPLVVIDPEDTVDANRLPLIFGTLCRSDGTAISFGDWQAALRSLATPPKPDEPTGLGAVVEDRYGRLWVRLNHLPSTEDPWKPYDSRTRRCAWADIDAVKILSAGVQP